jgi:hypothetical protein
MISVWRYYMLPGAEGGRMIIENACLILQIFQMSDGETREEVPMDVMNQQQAEREAQLLQANREELVERIARAIREDGTAQPLLGLHLHRSSLRTEPLHGVVEPSVCVIAQGSKEVLQGESCYRYDPSLYLLASVELPHVSQVLEASKGSSTSVCAWNSPPPSSARLWLKSVTPRLQALLMRGPSLSARWM